MSIPITAARMWLTRGTSPFRFTKSDRSHVVL